MRNLYIDFDGVIVDTMPAIVKYLNKNDFVTKGSKNLTQKEHRFARELIAQCNFDEFLSDSVIIANAFDQINNLINSNKYNVFILTHVCSLAEADVKVSFIRRYCTEVSIIPVPRNVPKYKMVKSAGAILVDDYPGNLRLWQLNGGIPILFAKEKSEKFMTIYDLSQIKNINI